MSWLSLTFWFVGSGRLSADPVTPVLEEKPVQSSAGRVFHVDQRHPKANDAGKGEDEYPFRTISAATKQAGPGDTVLVGDGIYRECVRIFQGGETDRPLVISSAPGATPIVRGTDLLKTDWEQAEHRSVVYFQAPLPKAMFAGYALPWLEAFQGPVNPFHTKIMVSALGAKRESDMKARPWKLETAGGGDKNAVVTFDTDTRRVVFDGPPGTLPKTLGQVFMDGEPLRQVASLDALALSSRSFLVSEDGERLLVHLPGDMKPEDHEIEITTRAQCLVPVRRGIGHVILRGLTFERAANQGPFPQAGIVSTRSGSHWLIEDCIVRHATTAGIDCGGETYTTGNESGVAGGTRRTDGNIIRHCRITDNGLSGIVAYNTKELVIERNLLERNNRIEYIPRINAGWWEQAAIKLHISPGAVIEGNLIRDNEAFGIWIDTGFGGSRISRNTLLNNKLAGVFGEASFGPLQVDNNIVAYTRSGHGIYMHDGSGVNILHNLIFRNAGCGVFLRNVRPVTVKYETSDNVVYGNLILGNYEAAVGLPLADAKNRNNTSNWNVLSGGTHFYDNGPVAMLLHSRTRGFFQDKAFIAGAGADLSVLSASWKDEDIVRMDLDLWQRMAGHDGNSIAPFPVESPYIGLRSRELDFELDVPEVLATYHLPEASSEFLTPIIARLTADFFGNAITNGARHPGPFQNLKAGRSIFPINPLEIAP